MERNQEGRRGSMAASATTMNSCGPSRRRPQRSSNLRVFPEDDDGGGGRMEMYRSSSRSKRRRTRRGEGLASNRDDGDDSAEESLGEDEEDDFFRFPTAASSSATNPPPPASSSSSSMHQQQNQNHHVRRSLPSKPTRPPAPLSWSVAEEMIGVPIPRKARSSSLKRSQESIGGGGRGGELLMHRRQSPASPARLSPSSNTAMSPSSSNASVRKQKPTSGPKHRQPKVSKPSSSSTREIEIEVAEVLFGMTRQSPLSSPSRQESHHKLDSKDVNGWSTEAKSGASSPAGSFSPPPSMSQLQPSILPGHNLDSSTNSATAPKRRRPRPQVEKESLATRIQMELLPPKADEGLTSAQGKKMAAVSRAVVGNDSITGSHLQESATRENGNSVPEQKETEDETTATKSKEASCSNLDEATANKAPREEKFSIDLMAPPPWGNSELEGLTVVPVKKLDIMNGEIENPDKSLKQEATTTTTECTYAGEERNAVKKCMANGIHSKNKCTTEEKQILELGQDMDLEKKDKDGLSLCGSSKVQQQTKQQQPEEPRPDPKPSDKNGPSVVSAHPASLQLTMPIAGWPGNFPHFGYVGQVPSLPAVIMPMDGSSVTTKTCPPPRKRKRCATHCYIAQTIRYNQQIARMNPFWPPAAAGTPLVYGAKPCNPNGMLQSENAVLSNLLQGKGSFPGRSSGQLQDKASPAAAATYAGPSAKEKTATAAAAATNSTLMEAHRNQFLLQQAPHPGSAAAAAPNMLYGPAFIFPTAPQPPAATPSAKSNQGICNSSPSAASVSSIAAGSGPPVHPVTNMSFNYPTLLTNDAQYLAFLQNNGYAFPTPTHVGGGPLPYGGANPARAMPFFPGPFYPSPPMLNPYSQQQHPAHSQQVHHNTSTSTSSSSSQEHHSQQSQQPPGGAGAAAAPAGGNSHSFPASNQHLHLLPPQSRKLGREVACEEDAPSPADSTRTSQAQKSVYGNFAVPDHPQNSAPAAAALSSKGAGGSGCHKEKQQPQQNQANLTPSHAYAMSLAAAAAAAAAAGGAPGIDFSSMVQNRAFFQSLPEAARHHGHQQIAAAAAQAAQLNKSHHEDGKSGGDPGAANANASREEGKMKMISTSKPAAPGSSAQHSLSFSSRPDNNDHSIPTIPVNSSCIAEGSSRNANLMQLLANVGRTSNRSSIASPASGSAAVTAANPTSGSLNMQLPRQQQQQQQQNFIQLQQQKQLQLQQQMPSRATKKTSSHSITNAIVHSDRMPSGSTITRLFPQGASAGRPANSATSTSSAKNQLPHEQQQRQQQQKSLLSSNVHHQTHISFGLSGQTHLAGGSSNSSFTSAAAMAAGSRQSCSILKIGSAGGNGSPRASTSSKSGPASASLLEPGARNSPSSSPSPAPPPPASNQNPSSILGHPHITSASTAKFQQHSLHQPQRFFSNSYIQAAQYFQSGAGTSFASFYQQRLSERQSQQQQQSSLALAGSSDPAKGLTAVSASAFPCAVSSPVSAKPPADQKAAAAPGNQC
ncbi:protein TIME FOR COFFEE-like [Iris pallida]|uniref:Protein TIME FOR COFFEE-like n=1 Tax=Iris pallida TaxID=29817 RepID=A0AAX6DMQ0_IRIPA|nr:protein TIME FOR COFFEE-like [Iris pallida]